MVGVRMSEDFQGSIRSWADRQEDKPPLAAAIRRLVEIGLKVKHPAKTNAKAAARAAELAAQTIAKHIDKSVAPSSFREVRKDRPK